jgi:hypothetical protein
MRLASTLFYFLLSTGSLMGQVTSSFDTDTDGWKLINDSDDDTITISHVGSGGNPGGFIQGSVPTDTYPNYFWFAPAKFRGNLTYNAYGLTLTFSLQQAVAGNNSEFNGNYYEAYDADIIITSGNNSIYYHTSPKPALAPNWSTYTVTLDTSSPWHSGEQVSSPLATSAQIKAALLNVTAFKIRGNFSLTANTLGFDGVSMGVHPTVDPPVITSISPASGLAGTTVTLTGSNFNITAANNVVTFGGVYAEVLTASATSVQVKVPSSARADNITLVNTATGRSARSLQKFTPLFEGGGRIIRASFKKKLDLPMDPSAGDVYPNLVDVDNDGWIDIVVTERNINSLSILRNLGNGGEITAASFDTKVSLPQGTSGNFFADLDGDGKIDLGVVNSSVVNLYRNTSIPGTISFEAAVNVSGVGNTGGVHAADIDGDGRPEIMLTHSNGSVNADFFITQNISTPGRIEFAPLLSYFGGAVMDAGGPINTGDLDGDGKPEISVVHGFAGSFSIIKNNSTPGTISLISPFPMGETGGSKSVVIADIDNDGKNDLAWSGDPDVADIKIRRNKYNGGTFDATAFEPSVSFTAPLGYISGGLNIADINGDGKLDILQGGSNDMTVYENRTTPGSITASSFIYGVPYPGRGASYPSGPVVADLNGDNLPDMVMGTTNNTPTLFIYENQNLHVPAISLNTISPLTGPVGSTVTITGHNFASPASANRVSFGAVQANVLGGTDTELTVEVPAGATYERVSVTHEFLTSRYHLPFAVTFSPGTTFDASSFLTSVNFTVTNADYDVEVGDLDNDGLPDLVVEGALARTLHNAHTGGNITTSSFVLGVTSNVNMANPRLLDVDEDGKIDILSNNGIARNNSTTGISFENVATGIGNSAVFASWADYDLDGKTDFVSPSGSAAQALIYANWSRGGEALVPATSNYFDPISDAISMGKPALGGGSATADFDNDGFSEFAMTNPATDNLSVWRSNGTPNLFASNFTALTAIAVGDNPGRVYTGDLDVDGKMDLVLYHGAGAQAGLITVLHNESTAGNITFSLQDLAIGANGTTLAIGDLDGDGKPEIAVTSEAAGRISIFKNNTTPGVIDATSFAAPFAYTITSPRGIAIADLNLDGKPEIIVTRAGNLLSILENNIASGPIITFTQDPVMTYACEGETATFTTAATGTTNIQYRWQKFDSGSGSYNDLADGTAYSGTGTSTLSVVTTGFFDNGAAYRCKATGDLAADAFSDDATLVINGLPDAPTGFDASSCSTPAMLVLKASGAADGDYRWYNAATGGTVLETDSAFTTPSIATSTSFYVSIQDSFCESTRTEVKATISSLNKPAITFDPPIFGSPGNVSLCEGTNQKFQAPAGFTSYAWSNGESTREITITQSGTYSVVVEDNSGCLSPSSDQINVTIHAYPAADITSNGMVLTVSAGDAYQWYSEGEVIAGATDQSYTMSVLEYGEYSVDVTDNGCTSHSDEFIYLITGGESETGGWNVFPNPFNDELNIRSETMLEVRVVDMMGRQIADDSVLGIQKINLPGIAAGVYWLQLIRKDKVVTNVRLVKE